MHEIALCQSIIDLIHEQAQTHGFSQVKTIHLVIGTLSHVEPEALEFGFDAVSRGTPAQGATLVIERPEGQAFCRLCEKTVPLAQRIDPCPNCGEYQLVITGGEEMRVRDLEVQ